MKRISSRLTWWYKRGLPTVLFIFIGAFAVHDLAKDPIPFAHLAGVLGVLAIAYVLAKVTSLDLVDEVYEQGDSLLVRSAGKECSIPISEIELINYSHLTNAPRVVLKLKRSSIFGGKIAFVAKHTFIPMAKDKAITLLASRVKSGHGGA